MSSSNESVLKQIKALIRQGERGIREAQAIITAMLESLKPMKAEFAMKQMVLYKQCEALLQKAAQTQSDDDFFALSKLQYESEQLDNTLQQTVMFYSEISEELASLKQSLRSQSVPITLPAPKVGGDIAQLTQKTNDLLQRMVDYWLSFDDSREVREISFEKYADLRFTMKVSDVLGDGACGWRAFLTGVVRVLCGKELPFKPSRMTEFIVETKDLMFELVHILKRNPENANVISNLLSIPQNGAPQSLDSYIRMARKPGYFATNDEFRLLCVLFSLANPQLSQVNVFRQTPLICEIYQSISAFGDIVPVSNEHINIFQGPGHFKSIVQLTERVLPQVFSIDLAIAL
jgi:hypothetical protein